MGEFDLIAPEGSRKNKKIKGRGRGSGKGRSCGRGHDGQNSRSGGKVRPGFEGGQMPLYRRIARRGFSNYPFKVDYETVNIGTLDKKFSDGDTVDKEAMVSRKIIKNSNGLVKVLGNGEITKKLTLKIDKISSGAREKVEKAGGSVEELTEPKENVPAENLKKPKTSSNKKKVSESEAKEKKEATVETKKEKGKDSGSETEKKE